MRHFLVIFKHCGLLLNASFLEFCQRIFRPLFCEAQKTIIQMEFLKWNQSVIVFMTLEDLSQLRKCSSFSLLSRIELQILVESGMVQVKKVVAKWSSEDKATLGGDMHKFSLVNKLISMLFAHFNAFFTLLQKCIICPKIHK